MMERAAELEAESLVEAEINRGSIEKVEIKVVEELEKETLMASSISNDASPTISHSPSTVKSETAEIKIHHPLYQDFPLLARSYGLNGFILDQVGDFRRACESYELSSNLYHNMLENSGIPKEEELYNAKAIRMNEEYNSYAKIEFKFELR